MTHIHVNSREKALIEVDRLMTTDYMKDDHLSERAGYPLYYSTLEGCTDRWADLNCRFEVILDSKFEYYTIWIDERPMLERAGFKYNEVLGVWVDA